MNLLFSDEFLVLITGLTHHQRCYFWIKKVEKENW